MSPFGRTRQCARTRESFNHAAANNSNPTYVGDVDLAVWAGSDRERPSNRRLERRSAVSSGCLESDSGDERLVPVAQNLEDLIGPRAIDRAVGSDENVNRAARALLGPQVLEAVVETDSADATSTFPVETSLVVNLDLPKTLIKNVGAQSPVDDACSR